MTTDYFSIKNGEELEISRTNEENDCYEVVNKEKEIRMVPISSITKHSWFHGYITHAEAEITLSSEINGSFLVRKSKPRVGLEEYAISLRHDGSSYHYTINKHMITSRYHIDPELSFQNLSQLTTHYSKYADGLVTILRYPAINPLEPSISREVDEWEVDRLDITTGQMIWENEYSEIYKAVIKKRGLSVSIKTLKVSYKVIYASCNYHFYCLGGCCRC